MPTNGLTGILFTTVITRLTKEFSIIQSVAAAGLFYGLGFAVAPAIMGMYISFYFLT